MARFGGRSLCLVIMVDAQLAAVLRASVPAAGEAHGVEERADAGALLRGKVSLQAIGIALRGTGRIVSDLTRRG